MTHCSDPLPAQGTPEWETYRRKWITQVEQALEAQRRAPKDGAKAAPSASLSAPIDASVIGIVGNGAYSSSDHTSLDRLSAIFRDNGIVPLCYSYRGPGQSYGPEDTIKHASIRTYAEHFHAYLTLHKAATFHLWCYSLSGIACMQFLYDCLDHPAIISKIRSIALLASPVLLDGNIFLNAPLDGVAGDPLWRVISDYSVDFGQIPDFIRRLICSIHCAGDTDSIALCNDSCLAAYGITDHPNTDPNCNHLQLPRRPASLQILRASLNSNTQPTHPPATP